MKAETSVGTLYIEFAHNYPRIGGPLMGGRSEEEKFQNQGDAGTYCMIHRDDHRGEIVSQGRSIIHFNDRFNYNKEVGRKISLRNAIKKLYLPYEDRKALWDAYINRK